MKDVYGAAVVYNARQACQMDFRRARAEQIVDSVIALMKEPK